MERFDDRIIPTVATPRHAADEVAFPNQCLIDIRCIHAPLIGVDDYTLRVPAFLQRRFQGISHQWCLLVTVHFVRDNLIVEQVNNRRQVHGRASVLDIRDIRHPFLVWCKSREITLKKIWRYYDRFTL